MSLWGGPMWGRQARPLAGIKSLLLYKAALAPGGQFNSESLLSENNGMSANRCQQFKRILRQHVWELRPGLPWAETAPLTQLQHTRGRPGKAARTQSGQQKPLRDLTAQLTHPASGRRLPAPRPQRHTHVLLTYTVFAKCLWNSYIVKAYYFHIYMERDPLKRIF